MTEKRTHFSAGSGDHAFQEAGFDTCGLCGERKAHPDHWLTGDAAQAVPVAWRWRTSPAHYWALTELYPGDDVTDVQPLYASQPSPAATVSPIDLLNGALEHLTDLGERALLYASSTPVQRSSAATGYDEPQGYAASLRQQADWVEKARAGEMDSNDIDVDELRAAADFIERLTAVPQAAPQPTLVIGPNTTGGDENFAPASGLNYSAARLLLWFKSWDEAVQFNASLTRPEHS